MSNSSVDVVIVGAGPVGLYLAGLLLKKGISCKVLEKKREIDLHSKSLGIHPVSLELFDEVGITDLFLKKGLKINRGIAFWNRDQIGEISFENCPPPYPFILAIPQWESEKILEDWVTFLDSQAVIRGAEVTQFDSSEDEIETHYKIDGELHHIQSEYVIGCDGKNSFVRHFFNIPFTGKKYHDTYIMGDFSDNTNFNKDAAVYLHKEGLIESFPLPNGQRRWVAKTDEYKANPTVEQLNGMIYERLGHSLHNQENSMMSSFGVQHQLADTFHKDRVLLAGDSAHVVSPIGGQGMNLGWIGADRCAKAIQHALNDEENREEILSSYSTTQKQIARQVGRRAELNMHLGRKESSNLVYKTILKSVIKTPLSRILANIFTMRGLGRWPV